MKTKTIFSLKREARGFYRSADLRFSACRRIGKKKRGWIACDTQPDRKQTVVCPTLRDCRLWFAAALVFAPKARPVDESEERLKIFF